MKADRKKVLVVDDEVKISEVIQSFLESKGYTVFTAENGEQAFSAGCPSMKGILKLITAAVA